MSTFIEARVIQKVDTEANWLSNPLKLYQGEIAFVSDKYNFKLNNTDIPKTFAELEYYYKGDILGGVLPTDDLASKPDGVYRATISGTYNSVVVKEGYYTLLRKDNVVWKLESEVKMPMQDLTPLENRITENENKVDEFIRDFSVTTDTEFNAESDNPIANSAVTPLADALEGFMGDSINIDTSIVNWSSNIYGMTNGIEASDFNKTLTIDVNNYHKLKYRGVKWNSITTSELNEYKTIVGIDVNNDKIVLLDSVNSSTIPSVIDVDIDISNIKTIYIIKRNKNNTLPVISLESDKILKIKEFIELKTDDLNLILKSFLKNDKHIINTINNINYGYLKVDGTYDLSDASSKLIKNINTSYFDTLHFKGYKSLVSNSNVANYCSIIGYKSDNSKVVLLGSHNGAIAQSITDVEIDVSNYIRIDIAYSNYEVAVGYNPEISLYNKNDIQIEADSVKKFIEKSVTPLNRMLDSFKYNSHEVPTNSVSTFGYIRNDGTVITEDTNVKLLKDIDVNGYDKLYFKGYKAVVSTANVPNYCSIIGYKSDDSKIILLNAHNALLPQELLEREIDITDFVKISISYSNYGVALNFNPAIRLYGLNDEHENLDIVAKRTMSSFEISLIPKVDLTKNYFYPAQDLTTNFEFSILSIGYFGNMNVFKLKGGSISFAGNFEMANNSSTYDATKYNTIYVYNEYDIAKVYIEN